MNIRLENGMLKKETLINRARRVVSLKDNMGLLDDNIKSPLKPDKKYHKKISQKIVDKCIRVIRDKDNILPVKIEKHTRIAHVIISMHLDDETDLYNALEGELKTLSNNVERLVYDYPEGIFERIYAKEFDLIICSIAAKHDYGTNVARLSGPAARLMMTGWMKLGTPAIFINHFHPFITSEYKFSTDTIINTYGSTVYSMKRVVCGITGIQPFVADKQI
jgi:beta-N-acetylhexosaminidase